MLRFKSDALVSDAHRALYYTNLKVASSSMRAVFCHIHDKDPAQFWNEKYDFVKPAKVVRKMESVYDRYFKFTFVRNPWDRVVSFYESWLNTPAMQRLKAHPTLRPGMSFDAFVDVLSSTPTSRLADLDQHLALQTAQFPLDFVDFVGRVEEIDEGWRHVSHSTGLPAELPWLFKSNRRGEYRLYYCERTRDLVARSYAADVDALGYVFE